MSTIRPGFPNFPSLVLGKGPIFDPRNPKLAGAPVVFSAQATLTQGLTAVLNAQTLQSGFRTGYFIDEIRVSMLTAPYAFASRNFTGLSGAVSALFQTGKYQFSADAVPVGLLAPLFGQDYGDVAVGAATQRRAFATVRWMLPKPLYMPAGDVVLANVSLAALPLFDGVPVTVTVTYVGRIITQGFRGQVRDVPWLAWWTKNMSEGYKTATTRLRNPFKGPAHVQRFTQRTYLTRPSTIAPTPQYSEQSSLGQSGTTTAPYESIMIDDSRGYQIVNKYVAIGDVFDVARHAWTFGRELGPREQFNMKMTTVNPAGLEAGSDFVTNIGLVGYRSEAP